MDVLNPVTLKISYEASQLAGSRGFGAVVLRDIPDTRLNSLRPSDAYMRQYAWPSLAQIMACRLVSAKPLSEPVL